MATRQRSFTESLLLRGLGLALLSVPPASHAGGLLLYEVGTADVGLASAGYSARAQDASTVFTNPAGMTRLKGTQLTLGAQMLYGDFEFSPNGETSSALGREDGGNPVAWMPGGGMFITHALTPDLAVGFAATGNFGLSLEYDKDWVGRYRTQESTLMAASLLPSIAYRAGERLSLGASLNATYGILKERLAINAAGDSLPDGKMKLEDGVWGFGIKLGLLYEFTPSTRLGMTYNSEIELDFDPRTKVSGAGPVMNGILQNRGIYNSKVGMEVYIPQGVDVSVFHQVNDRWAVLGSLGWQDWSRFGRVNVSIDGNATPRAGTTDLDFKDTWHLALGAQYKISDPWLLNFGVAYDSKFQESSQIGPSLPANDAWRFGIGLQNQAAKDFEWGVAAEYLYGGTVDVDQQGNLPVVAGGRGDLAGSYRPRMYFISANFNWKF